MSPSWPSWWSLLVTVAVVSSVSAKPAAVRLRRNQTQSSFSLPIGGLLSTLRQADIEVKRTTFLYGPGADGGVSSPSGVLGAAYVTQDSALTDAELAAQVVVAGADYTRAYADSADYDGLKTLDDYVKLYTNGEWAGSAAPTGVNPGMLTNYTQDLLFSMERLSFSPFAVRRLDPSKDQVPFTVDDEVAKNVSGTTLASLFSAGRLFYSDHRDQASIESSSDRFAAACDAIFYICPTSGSFLPLAIRSNKGSNLVYTPADDADDWLLAKIMFNVDDFYYNQVRHLAATHYVTEVAYQAAVRTLSDDHPVLGLLARLMYAAFGIRPLAQAVLFTAGGAFDTYFAVSGSDTSKYCLELYNAGHVSGFRSNYFLSDLQNRGLINATTGPSLTSFPYYEDALPIYSAQRDFMSAFVKSYYASDSAVSKDIELQAWTNEARGPAGAIDFPDSSSLGSVEALVGMLTHFAHLVSTAHHAVNTDQLITGAAILPFHPTALYRAPPTTKGSVDNVASYLPPLDPSEGFNQVSARFARPLIQNTGRTLTHMFDDPLMLLRMNAETQAANEKYKAAMSARSKVIRARTFDATGLSQGMPFVWKALDPETAPWSLTI